MKMSKYSENIETKNEISTKNPTESITAVDDDFIPNTKVPEEESLNDGLLAELFHVLTAQRLTPDGDFQVGVRVGTLKKALDMNDDQLDEILEQLANQIDPLGLDVVEYELEGDRWLAIRSRLPAPVPLADEQYTVLAAIIYHVEMSEKRRTTSKEITDFLNRKNYLKPSKTREIIKELSRLGYVKRMGKHGNFLTYGPRAILEFNKTDIAEIIEKLKSVFL